MGHKAGVLMLLTHIGIILSSPTTEVPASGSSPSYVPYNLQSQMDRLSMQLEKFNEFYLTILDQKMTAMQTVLNALDGNMQALHEKAHTWSIFRHNIDAWTEQMKSLDHKVDLIKRSQDEYQTIETKLNSLEYAVNHILAKVNAPDEKQKPKDPDSDVMAKINTIHESVKKCEDIDGVNDSSNEINTKLSNILKHLVGIRQGNVNRSKALRNSLLNRPIYKEHPDDVVEFLREIESKVDDLIEKVSSKEFISADNTNNDSSDDILDVLQRIDDRTIQIYNEGNNQNTKLMSCCRSTSNELATFTDSADILLKRIERLLMIVQSKVEKRTTTTYHDDDDDNVQNENVTPRLTTTTRSQETSRSDTTQVETVHLEDDEEYAEEVEEILHSTERTRRNDSHMERVTAEEDEDYPEVVDFVQPDKTGCDQLVKRFDGIYKFGKFLDSNVIGRNFNERYCTFQTDGPGWTVIQNRGPFEVQENFNRSWYDYKHGFGNMTRDFWYGNNFIHRLVADAPYELRIELEDFDGVQVWAEYAVFSVDSEENKYKLKLSGFRGAVADSMLYHHDNYFSTYDRKNDKSVQTCCPCASGYGSGWWFDNCSEANLNGIYRKSPHGHNFIGIIWEHWHGDYSLKKTKMMIRPKRNLPSYSYRDHVESFSDQPRDP